MSAPALAALLLVSCDSETANRAGSEGGPPAQPPDPPTAEVVAALEAQSFGKNLLGKTMVLVGDRFLPADLQSAPEYYLIHYSASW